MAKERRIKTIEKRDGSAKLFVMERDDGFYRFVGERLAEELGETYREPCDSSGLYQSADAAERAAEKEVPWLRDQISSEPSKPAWDLPPHAFPNSVRMIKPLLGLLALLVVTLVTQVGGLAFALCWIASRFLFPARLRGWQRAGASIVLFTALYAALNSFVVPRLAALAGRVRSRVMRNPIGRLRRPIRSTVGSVAIMWTRGSSLC